MLYGRTASIFSSILSIECSLHAAAATACTSSHFAATPQSRSFWIVMPATVASGSSSSNGWSKRASTWRQWRACIAGFAICKQCGAVMNRL